MYRTRVYAFPLFFRIDISGLGSFFFLGGRDLDRGNAGEYAGLAQDLM